MRQLKEECGVFGIFNNKDAAALTALGLHALQHRGQEACGIITFDKNKFYASIVATSASKHMVELKKLIKSRTHALIEKPLSNKTINPKLTESVLKKIKKDKILVQVGYCLRFHPAIK